MDWQRVTLMLRLAMEIATFLGCLMGDWRRVISMTDEGQALTLYNAYMDEVFSWSSPWNIKPSSLASGRAILEADPTLRIAVMRIALDERSRRRYIAGNLASQICKRTFPYTLDDVLALLERLGSADNYYHFPAQAILRALARSLADPETLAACRPALDHLRTVALAWYGSSEQRKFVRLLDEILSGQSGDDSTLTLPADEWADQVRGTLGELDTTTRVHWIALQKHCATASGSAPTNKWLTAMRPLREQLGTETFARLAVDWLGAFRKSGNKPPEYSAEQHQQVSSGCLLVEENADLLRGLAWCCAEREDAAVAAALADAAIAGYRKITGVGPRSAKVAGACVYALKSMPGIHGAAQLERVRLNVKQPTYLKGIEKSLEEAARRAGMTREDLEELTVPTFGLLDGTLRLPIGTATVELAIAGADVLLQWYDAAGKLRKAEPADVKRDHKAEIKEVKRQRDDIARMLAAQRDRLERLPLSQRTWPLEVWRSRYLDHPLLGGLARRLIWRFSTADGACIGDGIWHEGQFVAADGQPIDIPAGAIVSPWHPVWCEATEVLAWRDWLERHEIVQPFKQAQREIYLLTDAERATRVYSNRFAGHILRQHQFNALCAARGWHNMLRLMVDDEYSPATLELPGWGLRAEFWIEGAGDEYGVDTNDVGTYLRVSTDQVRFYPHGAVDHYAHASGGGYRAIYAWRQLDGDAARERNAPIPLEQIPPVVLSEVLRDVDLFVGVASVGNDPTWQDGGPHGRYREYWQSYSFGDLSATAETRRQFLTRLLPRLAIADRCSISGRFLIVRGDLRTYKIHLGSSNILMEPNDQYLCIVPSRGGWDTPSEKVFLPFDGDNMLSLILSKAFLLAEDTKITDPTITRQIAH